MATDQETKEYNNQVMPNAKLFLADPLVKALMKLPGTTLISIHDLETDYKWVNGRNKNRAMKGK